MERRIFGRLADNDSIDESEAISKSNPIPQYYINPVIRNTEPNKIPMENALKELAKKQDFIHFRDTAPSIYFDVNNGQMEGKPSALASTRPNANYVHIYGKELGNLTKNPTGIAKVLLHELTHSLGNVVPHFDGPPFNKYDYFRTSMYDDDKNFWGRATQDAEKIFTNADKYVPEPDNAGLDYTVLRGLK